jgi:hypothetical protein
VTAQHPPANDRTEASAVTPGDALRGAILEAARAGRPAWPVLRGLKVPRLEQVPIDVPYGDGRAYMPPGEAFLDRARLALHEDALLALETDNGLALSRAYANSTACAQLRALAAAALRDVCGYPLDDRDTGRPSVCGYLGFGEKRAAGRAVTRGRTLWPKLAAWPWWALNPEGGPLPRKWWAQPRVVETLDVWRSG